MCAAEVRRSDVFICFSKSRPGEVSVALALKKELEQIGLHAFGFEDWSLTSSDLAHEVADDRVDRSELRKMLTMCSIVVLISPHRGAASSGVQTEIAELIALRVPVILLYWSPHGWHPLLEPAELAGINLVWSIEGQSFGDSDVEDQQRESIARRLAMASWLAHEVKRLRSRHSRSLGALLDRIPEVDDAPLLNFRLGDRECLPDVDGTMDVERLAADVAKNVNDEELQTFLEDWRDGTDLIAEALADDAKFSLIRAMRTFRTACESLCACAERRLNGNAKRISAHFKNRGLMFARLGQVDEAMAVLKQALNAAPRDEQYEIHQAMALAQKETDVQRAVASFDAAVETAPVLEIKCGLVYNRGALRLQADDADMRTAALEDFSFVADRSTNATLRHSALRARARLLTDRSDFDGAIADYSRILAEADGSPRTMVSAWMDRGKLYRLRGQVNDALDDWTRAIDAADATLNQKFRTLEARAALFEESKQFAAAAMDLEALANFTNAAPDHRDELRRDAERLRRQST